MTNGFRQHKNPWHDILFGRCVGVREAEAYRAQIQYKDDILPV